MHIATCDVNGIRDGKPFRVKKGRPVPAGLADHLEALGAAKKQTRRKGNSND